jgi:hypothetical protein
MKRKYSLRRDERGLAGETAMLRIDKMTLFILILFILLLLVLSICI